MTRPVQQLGRMFIAVPKAELVDHVNRLKAEHPDAKLAYGNPPALTVRAGFALAVAQQVLEFIRKLDHQTAAALRAAADQDVGGIDGLRNLSTWVGSRTTPAWAAVFNYSDIDPDRGAPWFSELNEEAQRILLLLVANAITYED